MTEQERFEIETKIRLSKADAKFDMMMNELKEQREDIRRINEKIDRNQETLSAKIDSKFDGMRYAILGSNATILIGIAAIVVSIWLTRG